MSESQKTIKVAEGGVLDFLRNKWNSANSFVGDAGANLGDSFVDAVTTPGSTNYISQTLQDSDFQKSLGELWRDYGLAAILGTVGTGALGTYLASKKRTYEDQETPAQRRWRILRNAAIPALGLGGLLGGGALAKAVMDSTPGVERGADEVTSPFGKLYDKGVEPFFESSNYGIVPQTGEQYYHNSAIPFLTSWNQGQYAPAFTETFLPAAGGASAFAGTRLLNNHLDISRRSAISPFLSVGEGDKMKPRDILANYDNGTLTPFLDDHKVKPKIQREIYGNIWRSSRRSRNPYTLKSNFGNVNASERKRITDTIRRTKTRRLPLKRHFTGTPAQIAAGLVGSELTGAILPQNPLTPLSYLDLAVKGYDPNFKFDPKDLGMGLVAPKSE